MRWTQEKDLRKQIQRLWDRGIILDSLLKTDPIFPIRLSLKTPSSSEMSTDFDHVRQWIISLKKIKFLRLEMKVIHHKILGENQVPASIWLDNLESAAKFLRSEKQVSQFSRQIDQTKISNPELIEWIKNHSIQALKFSKPWPKLLAVVNWIQNNPKPDIYLRQANIPGIDTKFIENNRQILMTLLDISLPTGAINQQYTGVRYFAKRYGFRDKPVRVRFRSLDSSIKFLPGYYQDFTVSLDTFKQLDEKGFCTSKLKNIFITENEINFLSFPEVESSLVIFGAGYGFDFVDHVDWLSQLNIYYWGDIDTHGFAILDQLRTRLPQTESLLMDEKTLLDHKQFWEHETKPETRQLPRLSKPESELYHDLIYHRFTENLRLEQERISYTYLLDKLRSLHFPQDL